MIITIDGPTASGKSTVARILAKKLGYYYLYSGLLYRALAYLLLSEAHYTEQILYEPLPDEDIQFFLDPSRFEYTYNTQSGECILFNKKDITPYLSNRIIDTAASIISTHKAVRDSINQLQRSLAAQRKNIIIDGRDAGSVVFPEAHVKIFLTASIEERAQRWCQKHMKHACGPLLKDIIETVSARDKRDSQRRIDPLVVAENAYVIDTTYLTIEETVNKIMHLVQNERKKLIKPAE